MTDTREDPWGLWERPEAIPEGKDVVGFSVHAIDGEIGKVDDARMDLAVSYLASTPGRGSSAAG